MHIVSVDPHSYHVEYTTDLGFPEEKTALSWSFRANLKQRSLLLRPGIDDGVPNSVPTHTVLRAHVVRLCISLLPSVLSVLPSLTSFSCLIFVAFCIHIHVWLFLCAAYFHQWGPRLVVANPRLEYRGIVRHRSAVFSGRRGT